MRRLLYLLAVISLAAPLPAQSRRSAQDTLAYTTTTVRLREKPTPTARALALLRQGTPVRLYECSEGWCSVVVSRLAGYVLEEFLTTQPQPIAQGRGYINSQGEWVPSPTRTADGQPLTTGTTTDVGGTRALVPPKLGSVVIAIPADRQAEFAAAALSSTFYLTLSQPGTSP